MQIAKSHRVTGLFPSTFALMVVISFVNLACAQEMSSHHHITAMPEDEMKVLLHSHYPKLAEANRKREEHEAASGHSLKGWWMLSQYSGRQRTD